MKSINEMVYDIWQCVAFNDDGSAYFKVVYETDPPAPVPTLPPEPDPTDPPELLQE